MCGIVGYIGDLQAAPILLDGLSKLEYRGYDSAGLAVYCEGRLDIAKSEGRLSVLYDKINGGRNLNGKSGIGHTRWATHGQPSDINAHPHLSNNGRIAIVHNGIIENYMKLKEMLKKEGSEFVSETDTEIVAHLIGYFYKGDLLKAVSEAAKLIVGSYALGVISVDHPDMLIAVRKDSPLILGYGGDCNFMASDVPAILKYTREVCYLDDGDIAVITKNSIRVYDRDLNEIKKEPYHITWDISAAEKGGYSHFMLKEIFEQPKAIRDTVSPRIINDEAVLDSVSISPEYIKNLSKIYIIACGSAYHVGVLAKYTIEKMVRKPVEAVLASEFRYSDPLIDENTLVIVISQSGETADTIAAMREAKRRGGRTLAIVNVVGSTISKEADDVIYTWAGPEIAVATTKAYSTQLAVIYLISLHFAKLAGTIQQEEYIKILHELKEMPEKVRRIIDETETIKEFASRFYKCKDIFFIGRNLDYGISLEGSLKLKEISYIHSEAYAAGELKHGTISLIEEGTLVVAIATHDELFDKMMSNVREVKARGAVVLGIATESRREEITQNCDCVFCVPDIHEALLPSLAVIPLQLFSYYIALSKGCDIDKPRNLAKSVTVE